MPGADPWSTGLTIGGGALQAYTGLKQAKASKELLRRQAQFANAQNQTYRAAQPLYLDALRQYAASLGIGTTPGVSQVGANHFALTAPEDRGQFGLGRGYGSYEDQLRLQAGEEDINRYAQSQANQLRHTLGQSGVAPEIVGAALARNQAAAGQQFGQFRRGLALNAGQERERRTQQLLSMLGPGLGAGAQAANIYGQQGAMAGQQAAQSFAGLGNIISQYQYQNRLGQGYGQPGQIDQGELLRLLALQQQQDPYADSYGYGSNF